MASFTTDEGTESHPSTPICIVNGGHSNGEIVYIQNEPENRSTVKFAPVQTIDCEDGTFQQIPNDKIRILFIGGPSGSGKSTYAGQYIQKYKQLHPRAKFFCFSKLDSDPAIDKLKPIRIQLTEDLINEPIEIDDIVKGSIVLFDDIDNISEPKLQKAIDNLKCKILELGRHRDIHCVITSHLINPNERKPARIIMNEMQAFIFFPQSGSVYQASYCLKQYFGLSPTQIAKILQLQSRWVMITKIYPNIILTEHEGMFVTQIKKRKKKAI